MEAELTVITGGMADGTTSTVTISSTVSLVYSKAVPSFSSVSTSLSLASKYTLLRAMQVMVTLLSKAVIVLSDV
jgi:hypothetical protein